MLVLEDERGRLMPVGNADNTPLADLQEVARLYVQNAITARTFARAFIDSFRDDHGQDWLDERKGLMELARRIAGQPMPLDWWQP